MVSFDQDLSQKPSSSKLPCISGKVLLAVFARGAPQESLKTLDDGKLPGSKAELLETPFGVGAALGFALALGFGLSTGVAEEPPRPPQAARTRLVIKKLTKNVHFLLFGINVTDSKRRIKNALITVCYVITSKNKRLDCHYFF